MYNKLRKLAEAKGVTYTKYQGYLVDAATIVVDSKDTKQITDFFLLAGQHLEWKDQSKSEKHPMLYLGQITDWKQETSKFPNNDYAYGSCMVIKEGANFKIYLEASKGNLISKLGPIKNALKGYKKKFFVEKVPSLKKLSAQLLDAETSSTPISKSDNEAVNILTLTGKDLEKYTGFQTALKAKIQAEADPAKQKDLKIQYNAVLKKLKHLCQQWEETFTDELAALLPTEEGKQWISTYQECKKQLNARKAIKDGKAVSKEALAEESDRRYTKMLKDVDDFYTNLEKKDRINIDEVAANLKDFKRHYKAWHAILPEGATNKLLKEAAAFLKGMETEYKRVNVVLTAFAKKEQELQKAFDANDHTAMTKTIQELEKIKRSLV